MIYLYVFIKKSDEEHALIAKLCNTLNDESTKVADNNKIIDHVNEVIAFSILLR